MKQASGTDPQGLIERIERLEHHQRLLQDYLKQGDEAKKLLLKACESGDLAVVRSVIELGLVGIDDHLVGRTALSRALKTERAGALLQAQVAHYPLDRGANPRAQDSSGIREACEALTSAVEMASVDRFQLLARCESSLCTDDRSTQQFRAFLVTRAILSGCADELRAHHLQFNQAETIEFTNPDDWSNPTAGLRYGWTTFRAVLCPINYIALQGSAQQFHDALEAGLRPQEFELIDPRDYKSLVSIDTGQWLDLLVKNDMERQQHVAILTSYEARRCAQEALEQSLSPRASP